MQISRDLLSESQSVVFADMVRDIVRQLKLNPNQIPVPTASRRNVDKVKFRDLSVVSESVTLTCHCHFVTKILTCKNNLSKIYTMNTLHLTVRRYWGIVNVLSLACTTAHNLKVIS